MLSQNQQFVFEDGEKSSKGAIKLKVPKMPKMI
jgi:hypothetical protein